MRPPVFFVLMIMLQYLEELEDLEALKGPAAVPGGRPLRRAAEAAAGVGELGRGALRPLVRLLTHSRPCRQRGTCVHALLDLTRGLGAQEVPRRCGFCCEHAVQPCAAPTIVKHGPCTSAVTRHVCPVCPIPRAQPFDPAQHKLLCEELKHLYTGGPDGGLKLAGGGAPGSRVASWARLETAGVNSPGRCAWALHGHCVGKRQPV